MSEVSMHAELPISDAHAHISITGLGPKRVAKKFKDAGGWFMAVVLLPPYHYGYGMSFEDFVRSVNVHIEICSQVRQEGLTVSCIAGAHPAFIDKLVKGYQGRYDKLMQYIENIVKYLEGLIKQGKIDGLGEFGRPHYKTLPEVFAVNDYVLIKVLELVKDYNVVIHLHLEDKGEPTVKPLTELLRLLKLSNTEKVIVHHASLKTASIASASSLSVTLTGKYEVMEKLMLNHTLRSYVGTLIESDFIDDPRRPGVVMYPWEIRDSTMRVLKEYPDVKDYLVRIFVDNVSKVYEVSFR